MTSVRFALLLAGGLLLGAGSEAPFATDLWGALVALVGAALVLAGVGMITRRRGPAGQTVSTPQPAQVE